jgi:hypothetical protein
MRRFPRTLIVVTALATFTAVGQASAGQNRQRSAPPSRSRGEEGGGSGRQGGRSGGGPQAQRRDTPAPQAPRNAQRDNAPRGGISEFLGWLFSDNDRYDDNRYEYSRYDSRSYSRQAIPRDRYDYGSSSRDYAPSYRYSDRRIVIAPRQPRRFTSSWFSFRPQTRMSFGLTLGYPVDFPTWYDPYMVGTADYARPYMPYGGVTFDVEPRDAELWVDGEYVGRVSDFTSYDPPLTLVAGRHHIELGSRSFRSIEFDITVVAGQVIPYQGTLPYVR